MSGEYFTPQHVAGTRAGAEGWQAVSKTLVKTWAADGDLLCEETEDCNIAVYLAADVDPLLAELETVTGKLERLQKFVDSSQWQRDYDSLQARHTTAVEALKRIEMESLLTADPVAHLQIIFDTAKAALALEVES